MSSSKRHSRHVAHVEDCEDDSVEGNPETRKYAVHHDGAPISPPKERPNTSKSRSSEKRPPARSSGSSSAASQSFTDSESVSTAHSEEKERNIPIRPARDDKERERRRRPRPEEKPVDPRAERKTMAPKASKGPSAGTKQQRPAALRHAATQPEILHHGYRRGHVEDPSCYGVTTQPAPPQKSRPRNARPVSYSAGVGAHPRPPIAHSGWHQTHQPGPPPFPVGTFPPPMFSPSPGPGSMAAPSPSSIGSQGYFDAVMGPQYHANLRSRFEGRDRPSSAMGFSQSPTTRRMHHDEYNESQPRINRRPSRSRRHEDEDRKNMPPPSYMPHRPKSAMPTTSTPFAPPPRPPSRPPSRPVPHKTPSRQVVSFAPSNYDDDEFDEGDGLFQDMSPEPSHDPRRKAMVRTRHMSGSFEPSEFSMPSPTSTRGPRLSRDYSNGPGGASLGIYGTSADYESRIHEAARYQEAAGGGQSMPLTAESLRANSRAVASSRSTRSSGSRGDDSDFKRSNTTGLTRISDGRSPDDGDYIVKVSGAANIRFPGGAEIATDGGEIMFSARQGGALLRSGDSEVASTAYQLEDSYSRIDAPPQMKALPLPHRSRAPSQSDSRSLAYPAHAPYEPGLANYYYDDGRLQRDY